MAEKALKLLNGVYGFVMEALVIFAVLFASYSIWDNTQVYRAAEDVQNQIRQLKPDTENLQEGGPDFDELRALNGDVVAWLTVDDTNIDYPVLQGDTNLTYMNKDVYGDFSMAGSIFLDVRNAPDFSDNYSLIYGHNMDEHLMFGDLALFKDKEYFMEHSTASLILPSDIRDMKTAAVLQLSAGTDEIFNPDHWDKSLKGLGEFLKKNSIWYHADTIDQLTLHWKEYRVVTLVTCSDGSTNDRTVLVLIDKKPKKEVASDDGPMKPGGNSDNNTVPDDGSPINNSNDNRNDVTSGTAKPTGDAENPMLWKYIIAGTIVFIVIFEVAERRIRKRNE